jgi:anti-sigma-K factor RskA
MRLARSAALDALCGEYLLGTLRGGARRRFERALAEEPLVAQRLAFYRQAFATTPKVEADVPIPERVWQRIAHDLRLERHRRRWWRSLALWQAWAAGATIALALAIGLRIGSPGNGPRDATGTVARPSVPPASEIALARLAGEAGATTVDAALSGDRGTLALRAARPVIAGPLQSYELWLLPAEGGAPISMAVLGTLDARVALAPAMQSRLRAGAKLAISVEPAGGSPTGAPTGAVILVGEVRG